MTESLQQAPAESLDQQLESLVLLLSHSDGAERVKAIRMLGELRDSRAYEPLSATLWRTHEDLEIRCRAALALGRLGDIRAFTDLLDLYQESDEVCDPTLRQFVVEALGILRDPRAIPALIDALAHEDAEVRKAAWPALTTIGGRAVPPLIDAVLALPEKPFAARALGELGDERAIEPLMTVLSARHRSEYTRLWAADALGRLQASQAFDLLLYTLLDERESVLVRRQAAVALCHLGDPRAVEPVVSVVDQPTTAWTGDLVDALGVLGHERAVDALVGVLMGDNMPLRERAARALGMIGSRRALDPLRVVGEKHTGEGFWDRRIREAATNAVDRIEEMHPE